MKPTTDQHPKDDNIIVDVDDDEPSMTNDPTRTSAQQSSNPPDLEDQDLSVDNLSFLVVHHQKQSGLVKGQSKNKKKDKKKDKNNKKITRKKKEGTKANESPSSESPPATPNPDDSSTVNDDLKRAKSEYQDSAGTVVTRRATTTTTTTDDSSMATANKNVDAPSTNGDAATYTATDTNNGSSQDSRRRHQSQPGAFGIVPPIGLRNDNDSNDSSSFFPDIETGEANHNNMNLTEQPSTEELIHAELVVNENLPTTDNTTNSHDHDGMVVKPVVHAEILKDADTARSRKRRRAILISLIVLVMGAIVIAVTVGVLRRNRGSTTEITTAPTTASPTTSPSGSPSLAPSESPSSAPSYLSFGIVPNENKTMFELSSIDPNQVVPDFRIVDGGHFGQQVFIRDIQDSLIGNLTNKTTMLAVSFQERQSVITESGFFPYSATLAFYFCHPNTDVEHDTAEGSASCEAGVHLRSQPVVNDVLARNLAISGDGQIVVMASQQQVELYDLRAAAQSDEGVLPARTGALLPIQLLEVENGRRLGLNFNGDKLVRSNATHLVLYSLDLDSVLFEATKDTSSLNPSPPLISEFLTWEFPPTCDNPLQPCMMPVEKLHVADLALNDNAILLGADIDVPPNLPPCLSSKPCAALTEPFNGYRLRIFDYNLNPIGNVIEKGENRSLVHGQEGLAMAANANVFAVSSAVFARRDFVTEPSLRWKFQVDVYRLDEESTTWVPMGSSLHGLPEGGDFFGYAISLSGDGKLLSVSTYLQNSLGDPNEAAVVSFKWDGTLQDWHQFGDEIQGSSGSQFGASLALHPSGKHLLVGDPSSDLNGPNTGESFLFGVVGV